MLRFNTSKHPPVRNYFSRREQWRLLLLVMTLGVLIIAMRALRQPETADQLARLFAEPTGDQISEVVESSAPTRVTSNSRPPVVPPELRREALEAVRDNTYFRNAEKDVWFRLIALLQESTVDELNRGSIGEVTYVQLVDQPRTYRAQLVTVRGTARQVTEQTPADNNLGLKAYQRLVVEPSDGTQWPIFVYCLKLPEGFPRNTQPSVDVTASGFFFKNLSYGSPDGMGIAPVILAKSVSIGAGSTRSNPTTMTSPAPAVVDSWSELDGAGGTPQAPSTRSNVRGLLSLAGWDAQRFAAFVDDQPLSDEERSELVELLWRVRSFDAASEDRWSRSGASTQQVWDDPPAHRGEMVRLNGHVVSVNRRELSQRDADRLDLPAYFLCEIELTDRPERATVVAASVPKDWLKSDALNEPASASAVFVKRMALAEATTVDTAANESSVLFVARRIAWHPRTSDYPRVSLGKSLLGRLGMDVGLFDDVQSRGPIRAVEREPFYQMLHAAGRSNAKQLVRAAQDNLRPTRARWLLQLQTSPPDAQRALAQEVIRRADEGRYSVAPLFNEPQQHIGELASFDGVVRRVVRIDVGTQPDGSGPSDVAQRFGIQEYYEMEIFTDDSQNYPLVFCVRELPAGLPTGGDLRVPVSVAGFFFKDWLYTTRGTRNNDAREISNGAPRSQFAPLLIGSGPIVLPVVTAGSRIAQWILGGLFLLALAGVWAAVWWFGRDDRKSAARISILSLPPGQSLNDLNFSAANQPIDNTGGSDSSTTNSQ